MAEAEAASDSRQPTHDGLELLALLLEHPAIGEDLLVVCQLLQTSRQAAYLVADRCAGRLDVSAPTDKVLIATAWLDRNENLLRLLHCKHRSPVPPAASGERAAARPLRPASAVLPAPLASLTHMRLLMVSHLQL